MDSDPDVEYDRIIEINLDELEPMAACPSSPDNIKSVKEIAVLKTSQVVIGSCTNSSFADLMMVAKVLKDRRINNMVEFAIAPGSKEVLKGRYWKVTDEREGKCIIEKLPRVGSGGGRGFRPISLRPYEEAPRKYRKMLERFPKLTYYHLKYPGDYKHYIFRLVLPRNDHRKDYRMRVYSAEGELLLEED